MNCPQCGTQVTADDRFCRKCYAIIQPPSLWQKLRAMLRPKSGPQAVSIKKIATVSTTKITINREGKRHVYDSVEELPSDQRAEIERLKADALSGKTGPVFTVRDASGQERVYHSLEEMPAEIRTLVERIQAENESK